MALSTRTGPVNSQWISQGCLLKESMWLAWWCLVTMSRWSKQARERWTIWLIRCALCARRGLRVRMRRRNLWRLMELDRSWWWRLMRMRQRTVWVTCCSKTFWWLANWRVSRDLKFTSLVKAQFSGKTRLVSKASPFSTVLFFVTLLLTCQACW